MKWNKTDAKDHIVYDFPDNNLLIEIQNFVCGEH